MADDAEKMAALKRAYADIILNTAKESAARILASERRVLQLQRSLSLAKEESLAMLLRLKAIMDAKINESEKANLSQVRKIQELEFQLSEAKGTMDYLRAELKRLNSELDHKRDIQAELLDGKSADHIATSVKDNGQENIQNSDSHLHSPSGPKGVPSSDCCLTKGVTQDEPLKNLIASDNYGGNPDLASIILSNKEPEHYRNGCTQRIRAFERNPVTGIELSTQIHDQVSNIESETITCENEKTERPGTKDFAAAEKKGCHMKRKRRRRKHIVKSIGCDTYPDTQRYKSLDTNHSKVSTQIHDQVSNAKIETITCADEKAKRPWTKDFGIARKQVRRRLKRHRKCVMGPTVCGTYHDMQHSGLADTNHPKVGQNDFDISADKAHRTGSETPLKMPNSCSPQVSEDQETTKSQRTKLNKPFSGKSSGILNGDRITTRRTVLKPCNTCENHIGRSHTSSSGTTCEENSHTGEMINDALSDEDVKNGTPLEEVLTKPDHKLAEDLDTPVTKENHETVDVLHYDYKDEPSRPPAAEAGSDKILKYTFQRKRKRGSLHSKVESASLEENMTKRKVDEDNAILEPQKSSLAVESSRQSRRLAQVARQLISLSERRWW